MSARLWKTAAIAGGISVLAAILLLVGVVLVLVGAREPDRYIGIWSMAVFLLGSVLAGAIASKLYYEKPFTASLVAGGVYTLLSAVMLLPFGAEDGGVRTIVKVGLPLLVSSLVGGLLNRSGATRYGNHRKAAKHAGKIYKGKR